MKEVLQGIDFLLIGIPTMIIASVMDQIAFKKEREQHKKTKEPTQ